MTRQRREILKVLQAAKDHPSASEIFVRARDHVPGLSLATVYNCLETLSSHGLVTQVNLDRAPSRFCANQEDHVHFHCDACGVVFDAPARPNTEPLAGWILPEGTQILQVDLTLRGLCPSCASSPHSP